MNTQLKAVVLSLALALVAGCGDDSSQLDSRVDKGPLQGTIGGPCYPNSTCNQGLTCSGGRCAVVDAAVRPDGTDGGPTAPCTTPGKACVLADPCAIDPVCGADLVCRPTRLQSCDDGLTCTTDTCLGLGRCAHAPLPKSCALAVVVSGKPKLQCFADGDRSPGDPCQECASATSATTWSPANGGACDDGDPCTKNDYCQAGACAGASYGQQCDDKLSCTDDLCDGKGGCLTSKLQSTACLINNVCFANGASSDPSGCSVCDVSKSQSAWTPLVGGCTISLPGPPPPPIPNAQCFKAGAREPGTGCSICDPAKSTTAWTPLAPGSFCTIATKCYLKGEAHAGGCASCDPGASATAWTVASASCLIADQCYTTGQTDLTGCGTCDPTKSKTDWTTITNVCLIGGKCFTKGTAGPPPCATCDPTLSTTSWTIVGTACLINDTCYTPGQGDTTGCGTCDPTKSKTAWTPVANTCLIGGKCYKNGTVGVNPCGVCDAAANPTGWTIVGTACLISNACYTPGQGDVTGCGTCDPTKSKAAWTPVANKCLIGGTCFADATPNPATTCLVCKYATNPSGWSPVAGITTTSYNFEDGKSPPTGWTISNSDAKVGWVVSNRRPGAGTYSLYYGDPAAGSYASANANTGTATLPAITLTAGKKSGLSFLLWMDTEDSTSYDTLEVYVGTAKVWQKDATTYSTMKSWKQVTIDLSSYAGQTITIKLKFDTMDSISNDTEGVYVDDLTIYDNC